MRTLADFTGQSSLAVLQACGITVRSSQGERYEFEAACPVCGGTAGVTHDRVVCENAHCNFGSSRVIDLLATRSGGYPQVAPLLRQRLPGVTANPQWPRLADYINQAHLRYWLRDTLVANRCKFMAAGAQVLGRVRKSGYPRTVDADLIKVLDAAALLQLKQQGFEVPRQPSPVASLWTLEGEFAGVSFMDRCPPVTFFPRQVLVGWRPRGRACLGLSAAVAATEAALRDGRPPVRPVLVPLHCQRDSAALEIEAPADAELLELGKLLPVLPALTIGGRTADDWLLAEVVGRPSQELSMRARRILSTCPVGTALQFRIEQTLLEAGNLRALTEVRKRLQNRNLFEHLGVRVRTSPHGYLAEIPGKEEVRLTNFVITLSRNLVFDDLAAVYHEAEIEMAGQRWPATLAASELANVTRLETALRGQAPPDSSLPTLFEPSRVTKLMLPFWRRGVADLLPVKGVSSLGWTTDRGRFQGAGWAVGLDDASEEAVTFQPGVEVFRCFTTSALHSSRCAADSLPLAARDLVAMLAGLLCRGYVRGRVRALQVQNNHPARLLVKAVFAGIGQRKAFEMSGNLRNQRAIQGLAGHPFWGTGYNPLQVVSCPLPGIFLTETGYGVPDADYTAVTLPAAWIIRSVVSWLLATEGQEFHEKSAFHYADSVQQEGAEAIAAACKLDAWEISPPVLPALEVIIRPHTAQTVGAVCRAEEDQILILTPQPGDLMAELLGIAIAATRHPGGVRVPALQLTPLLYDYFGGAPVYSEGGGRASLEPQGPVTTNGRS